MSRRFQFSLRALLVVVLMSASFFGGIAVKRKEANDLQKALKAELMAEKESNAKLATQMRDAQNQLIQAEKHIKELEGH